MMEYALVLVAYLLGSIPVAIVVARAFGLADPRTTGSKNPGATNVLRYGGKTAAAITLLGDALKGVVAVLLVRWQSNDPYIISAAALAVFLGHLYPVFFGFRGGKGVATALGVWAALVPWVAAALVATWLAVALIFRYSSLAALVAAAAAPFYVWRLTPVREAFVLSLVMSALLFWRHRDNIRKLLAGTEGKIGAKPASAGDR